jgi:hypothetical protein
VIQSKSTKLKKETKRKKFKMQAWYIIVDGILLIAVSACVGLVLTPRIIPVWGFESYEIFEPGKIFFASVYDLFFFEYNLTLFVYFSF